MTKTNKQLQDLFIEDLGKVTGGLSIVATTLAIGEEDEPTTAAVSEEDEPTTALVSEEDEPTTAAVAEE
ncbi:hypothetical protein G6O69_27720 [Pseudenhygromyxa sp. WMMC2535]|uniref:hypothetical protein n=1 Tax=Pseudenhygromyxa sp. WMMC2535 TaxID=2712867 RepID=UPI0015523B61|nr:hypothetical protein [Pseudenhygromyxa sp. WMMC2535]NVB41658.1 hypothetical protein [Pseudenhygromyxa sp. WMMC2535]